MTDGSAGEVSAAPSDVGAVVAPPQLLSAEDLDALEEPSAPENDVLSVEITDGLPGNSRIERGAVKRSRASKDEMQAGKPSSSQAKPSEMPVPKLSPDIPSTSTVDVLIRYVDREPVRVPRMPRLNPDEPRDSAGNAAVREKAERLIKHVRSLRANEHARHADRITARGGAVKEEFWLLNALSARVPYEELQMLADDPDVLSIQAEESGGTFDGTIADGRALLNSDPYFNVPGINTGFIGLLDTGTRRTHVVLNGRIDFWRDCVNGTSANCSVAGPGLTLDPSDQVSHGTGVANILGGNSALGNSFRGVTGITLDSFRVGGLGINNAAVVRGFQAALAASDDVINASFTCGGTDVSMCSDAADSAFDSGAVVVSTMGNEGKQKVGSPGEGHKVLAVGAVGSTGIRWTDSNTGPATDGRTKPDLMGHGVGVLVAGTLPNNPSDNLTATVSGTSFGAAFVSGGSALMRRWLKMAFPNLGIEPGYVTAMMIASGGNMSAPTSNFTIGAGTATLPTNATLWVSKVSVTNAMNQDFAITIPSGKSRVRVSLWWPEPRTRHNDVDLTLLNSSGAVIASSLSTNGIWEKTSSAVTAGSTYKIRARGFSVSGTQSVFIAAIAQ